MQLGEVMDTVFEVLNGHTITTFHTVASARIYLHSVAMETINACVVMVATRLHKGEILVMEELIEVRHRQCAPVEEDE